MSPAAIETVNLILTGECDSRCLSCSYWLHGRERLTAEYVESLLPHFEAAGVRVIRLTGGEPTLHPELLRIAHTIKQRTTTLLVLNTHGGTLPRVFPNIRHFFDGYIISLDSATRAGYEQLRGVDWFQTVRSLPSLIHGFRENLFAAFSCVIQRGNLRQLSDIAKLAHEAGANVVSFSIPNGSPGPYLNREPRFPKQLAQMLPSLEELELLEEEIERVEELRPRLPEGFILQEPATLRAYVKLLARWQGGVLDGMGELKACGAPLTTLVVNERRMVKPCFILPHEFALAAGEDAVHHPGLTGLRTEYMESDAIRAEHCVRCYVYPYVMAGQKA